MHRCSCRQCTGLIVAAHSGRGAGRAAARRSGRRHRPRSSSSTAGTPTPRSGGSRFLGGRADRPGAAFPSGGKRRPSRGKRFPEGEPSPLQGEAFPLQGEAFPLQGEALPLQGEAFPLQGEASPLQGEAFPLEGEPFPLEGERPLCQQPVRQEAPPRGETPPPFGDGFPLWGGPPDSVRAAVLGGSRERPSASFPSRIPSSLLAGSPPRWSTSRADRTRRPDHARL